MPNPISPGPLANEREVFLNPPAHAGGPRITRRQRRARRAQGHLSAKDGRIAAKLARLDYKTASESGALTPPSKTRVWHLKGRLNGHAPPAGRGWDRAGPARVVVRGGARATDSTTQ